MVPRAEIIYLAKAKPEKIAKLKKSLQLLDLNFLRSHPYPVRIYVEDDFTQNTKDELRRITPSISFYSVDLKPPAWVDATELPTWVMPQFGVGYRSMCRFFIWLPEMLKEELDWYMRLDDDSFVESPMDDLFEKMVTQKVIYCYRAVTADSPMCSDGILEFLKSRAPEAPASWDHSVFYTNFHATATFWWLQPRVHALLKDIDESGRIYKTRWGDHIIQTLILQTFAQQKQLLHTKQFAYRHHYFWPVGR